MAEVIIDISCVCGSTFHLDGDDFNTNEAPETFIEVHKTCLSNLELLIERLHGKP